MTIIRQSIRSFNISLATQGNSIFVRVCGWEFEPCLGGVGNLNPQCQVFSAE